MLIIIKNKNNINNSAKSIYQNQQFKSYISDQKLKLGGKK